MFLEAEIIKTWDLTQTFVETDYFCFIGQIHLVELTSIYRSFSKWRKPQHKTNCYLYIFTTHSFKINEKLQIRRAKK